MKIRGKTIPFFVVKKPNKRKGWNEIYKIESRDSKIFYSTSHYILGYYSLIGTELKVKSELRIKSVQTPAYISLNELSVFYKKKFIKTIFQEKQA